MWYTLQVREQRRFFSLQSPRSPVNRRTVFLPRHGLCPGSPTKSVTYWSVWTLTTFWHRTSANVGGFERRVTSVMWGFTFMSGSDSRTTGRVWHAAAGDLRRTWAATTRTSSQPATRTPTWTSGLKLYTPCGWSIPNTTCKVKKAAIRIKIQALNH